MGGGGTTGGQGGSGGSGGGQGGSSGCLGNALCDVYCPHGVAKDGNGCDTCSCNPPPGTCQPSECGPAPGILTVECWDRSPTIPLCQRDKNDRCQWTIRDCPPRPADAGVPEAKRDAGVPDGSTMCGPVCGIYCPYGNVLDSRGCPTCQCNPPPKCNPAPCPPPKCEPLACKLNCPNGFETDANGCQFCQCKPVSACGSYTDARGCATHPNCTWLAPGCSDPTIPAAGCYARAALGCMSNADCKDGRQCLKRNINPCSPGYQAAAGSSEPGTGGGGAGPPADPPPALVAPPQCQACSAAVTICL